MARAVMLLKKEIKYHIHHSDQCIVYIQNTLHFIDFICSIQIRLSYPILLAFFACEAEKKHNKKVHT